MPDCDVEGLVVALFPGVRRYHPAWPDAEVCLYWWQRLFSGWILNREW